MERAQYSRPDGNSRAARGRAGGSASRLTLVRRCRSARATRGDVGDAVRLHDALPWRRRHRCDTLKETGMAGSRTRYGFAGGGGPDGGLDPRSSRTLLGHDAHLVRPNEGPVHPAEAFVGPEEPEARPATQELPPTREVAPAAGPVPSADSPARVPSHSGKSNYPTVARMFG